MRNIIEEEKIERISKTLLDDDKIINLSELFKVFGDYTRLKIINVLLEDELCVHDIANLTNTSQSAVSHQLKILKQAKLVKYRKVGKIVYYSILDNHVYEVFKKGCEHIYEI